MKAQDVLADQVVISGPEHRRQISALEAGRRWRVGQGAVVVQQRVEPDIEDVLGIPGNWHAPSQAVARQGYVAQAGADEGERLVVTAAGIHEILALRVERLQALLKGAQTEEVVLLALAGELDVMDRTEVPGIDVGFALEIRTARAVPTLVDALVDEAVLAYPLEDPLHDLHVLWVGCADEEVVAREQPWGQRAEALGVAVGELLWVDPERVSRVGDRLPVLVRPGQEEDLLPPLAMVACHHVSGDRRVRVTEMGSGVHVVDRRGHVEGHAGCRLLSGARRSTGPFGETPVELVRARPRQASHDGCRRTRPRPGGEQVAQGGERLLLVHR